MSEFPSFHILYLNSEGKELSIGQPITEVDSIQISVNIKGLIDNQLGTAIVKGFMDERKDEIANVIRLIRTKLKSDDSKRIILPKAH